MGIYGYRPFTAVLEAGRSSYVMADLLRELGGEVKLAHALQVKAIAQARIKTDKKFLKTHLPPPALRSFPWLDRYDKENQK